MINISSTTREETKEFNEKEWHGVDVEHYRRNVDYNEQEFRYKAEEDGKIVGTIVGKHACGVLYIDYLIVAKDSRGKGIGKALIKKAEEFGKEIKAHKIHLMTGKDWIAAKVYEAMGYKREAILPDHHFHQDFAIYEKFI